MTPALRRWRGRTPALALLALLVAWLMGGTASAAVPDISQPITDLAGVLSERGVAQTSDEIQRYHEQSGVQLAVLVVETTHGVPIEDYALEIAVRWRGGSASSDRGALLVLATRDRRMRLELGYGLEAFIPDSVAKRILDSAIPSLRQDNFDAAVESMVDEFIETLGRQHLDARPATEGPGMLDAIRVFPHPVLGYVLTFLVSLTIGLGVAPRMEHLYGEEPVELEPARVSTRVLFAITVGLGGLMWLIGAGWLCLVAGLLGARSGLRIMSGGFDGIALFMFLMTFTVASGLSLVIFWGIFGSPWAGTVASLIAQLIVISKFTQSNSDSIFVSLIDSVGANSGSSSSWTSSSSSSSSSFGSSFGSSSFSSSSFGSSSFGSSSFGSSSYSGGGGSFGGGGASSSW